MADYTLSAKLTADSSGFTRGIDQAKSKVTELSNKTKEIGKKIGNFGTDLTKTGAKVSAATLPLAALAKSVVSTGMQYQTSMSSVQAISGATAQELEKLEGTAREMGATTRYSASEAADALGFMALAGWDVEQMTSALPGVLNLATAGQLELAEASDIVTDMMSMFQMEATDAGKASDIFAAAQSKSNTNVSQLSEALRNAGPSAAALGMDLEQTSAILGMFANNGIKGGRAGTILSAMLRDVQAKAEDGAVSIGKTSVAVYDAEGNFRSMADIMSDVEKATTGMTDEQKNAALSSIFQAESIRGVNLLLGSGSDALGELEGQLYDSGGAAEEMAGIMDDNLGGSLANMRSAMEEVFIQFFELSEGPLRGIVDGITDLVRRFGSLDASTKQIIAIVAVLALALGPALMLMGVMASGVGALVTLFGFLISPIGLVITAITALAAAFGYQMATNEGFRNSFFKVFEAIRTKVTEIINYIVPIIQNLWTRIQPILSTMASNISSLFTSIGPKIIPALQNIGGQIADVFKTVWGIVQAVWPIFQSFFNGLIEGFGNATGAGSGFSINLTTLLIGLNPIIKGVIMLFQNFGPQIVSTFQEVSAMLVPVFGTIGQVIGQLATTVIPMVMAAFSAFIPMVVDLGMIIVSAIINIIPIVINLFNTLVPIIMMVVQQLAQVIAVVIPLAANFVGALIPAISMLIEGIMSVVTSVAPAFIAIIQMIGSAIQVVIPIISSILQTVIHVMTNIISVVTPIIGFIVMIITTIMGIISPIVAFIAGVMTSIFAVIRPIVTVVTGVFNTAAQVMATVWQGIMTFTGQIFTSIGSTISQLSGVVSNVFNTISGTINRIMNNVSNKITGVFDAIRNAWSGLTAFVSGVFDGISGSVSTLVGQVKGFVNGVIGGINSAIGLINKIPGVSISKIPQLYRGTDDWQGGFARINEGGRGELVNLPGGSQVIPHDVSMRYAREAGKVTANSQGDTTNQKTYNNQFTLNAPQSSSKEMRPEDWRRLMKEFAYYVNQEGGGLT